MSFKPLRCIFKKIKRGIDEDKKLVAPLGSSGGGGGSSSGHRHRAGDQGGVEVWSGKLNFSSYFNGPLNSPLLKNSILMVLGTFLHSRWCFRSASTSAMSWIVVLSRFNSINVNLQLVVKSC